MAAEVYGFARCETRETRRGDLARSSGLASMFKYQNQRRVLIAEILAFEAHE